MQMTPCKIYFCNEQQTQKKSREWFFYMRFNSAISFSPFLIIYHNRQKFFLLQKFNLTEFFVVVWWVYGVTFQLDKLVKMSNNKNNRWIFWAPLDDAAKQKAHILVEMDARVSIYGAIIYKILQSGVYFRTLFILAHKVICKKT